ncbi:hypothetical protein ACJMK2_022919, partial [Sinanodonta woodiana]
LKTTNLELSVAPTDSSDPNGRKSEEISTLSNTNTDRYNQEDVINDTLSRRTKNLPEASKNVASSCQ